MNPNPHSTPPPAGWAGVLAALAAAGGSDGADAAAWWQQDNLGGRTTGDRTPTARAVLAGLADLDPAVLDALPTPGHVCMSTVYQQHTEMDAPAWDGLDVDLQAQAAQAYRDSFQQAVHNQVTGYCHDTLNPETTCGEADLHPAAGGATGEQPTTIIDPRERGAR